MLLQLDHGQSQIGQVSRHSGSNNDITHFPSSRARTTVSDKVHNPTRGRNDRPRHVALPKESVTSPKTNLTGGENWRASTTCPTIDGALKLRKAIGQCRWAGLQGQRRFDLIYILMPHSRDFRKPGRDATRSGRNFFPNHEPMISSGGASSSLPFAPAQASFCGRYGRLQQAGDRLRRSGTESSRSPLEGTGFELPVREHPRGGRRRGCLSAGPRG